MGGGQASGGNRRCRGKLQGGQEVQGRIRHREAKGRGAGTGIEARELAEGGAC